MIFVLYIYIYIYRIRVNGWLAHAHDYVNMYGIHTAQFDFDFHLLINLIVCLIAISVSFYTSINYFPIRFWFYSVDGIHLLTETFEPAAFQNVCKMADK